MRLGAAGSVTSSTSAGLPCWVRRTPGQSLLTHYPVACLAQGEAQEGGCIEAIARRTARLL